MSSNADLTGQRFGKLVALYIENFRPSKGGALWMCACDCGITARIRQNGLSSGFTRSCGCVPKGKAFHPHRWPAHQRLDIVTSGHKV